MTASGVFCMQGTDKCVRDIFASCIFYIELYYYIGRQRHRNRRRNCSERRQAERKAMKKVLYEGPDISMHNGAVDIKRVRDAGYGRIGIRAGYGRGNVDERYISNALACYNLGVDVLLYWFSYAYTGEMAAAEAGYAIAQAAKYWRRCPIAYDFEYASVNYARKNGVAVTRELCTEMAAAFLGRIREAGYIPVLYANRDYLRNYFDMGRLTEELGSVYVWYARYSPALPEKEADIDIWQYTSGGRMPGVRGRVDISRYYTDFSEDTVAEDEIKKRRNINIAEFQEAANADGYRDRQGKELAADGIDGAKTQYVRGQILLKAKRSGGDYVTGSTGQVVRWWQRRCNEILGRRQAVDGKYGRAARAATIALQKRLNLAADGIAGYNSIQAAFYN